MAISANFPNIRPSFLQDWANGQTLDSRITFLRSGPAVYYDGKSSALAEQNLFIQSNTFTNAAWVATSATIASGVTAPDGTATAYSMTATAGNATLYQTLTLTATAYTESIWIQRVTGTGTINLTLDGTTLSPVTITGSWAKYTYTATLAAGAKTIGIQIVTSGDAINIYGSQIENRSSATATNITTTTAINNFIPTLVSAPLNTPRFNFNPTTGESLGFLVEGSSTNLFNYSEDFTNAYWGLNNVSTPTVSANIAPDGTQSAQLMVLGTNTVGRSIYKATTLTAAVYTLSWHVKYYGQQFVQLGGGAGTTFFCNFDLINGIIGTPTNCTPNMIPLGNGFYRISVTFTATSASWTTALYASNSLSASIVPSFAGNGFNGYYIWGAQLELTQNSNASSALTSYIKTTSAQVIRAADYPTITPTFSPFTNFSGWFNTSQGTWVIEAQGGYYNSSVNDVININNTAGAYLQRVLAQYTSTTSSILGSVQLNPLSNAPVNGVGVSNKIAYSYSNSNLTVSELGVTPVTSATNNAVPTATNMSIGYRAQYGDGWLNGHIKKLAYYPIALTSSQLQSLTGS